MMKRPEPFAVRALRTATRCVTRVRRHRCAIPDRKVAAMATRPTLQTLRKGARITGSVRTSLASDVRRRYEAGESIRALAEETGRSYGFIHRLLVDEQVPFRARGGATRRSEPK
jgi:hypothetical protein